MQDVLIDALGFSFAPATAAFALAAIGLNFHFGLTGLMNMGQAGFMLLGAYGYAISIREGLPMPVAILVAFGCAIVFGLILGWPTLRLRGDYLAIVTIAAAEVIRYVGRSQGMADLTGAVKGVAGNQYKGAFESLSPFPDDKVKILIFEFQGTSSNSWWLRLVAWVLVALFALLFWRLSKSPWGRVLKGIREDEDAVRSLGKNVYWYKMQALLIGGVVGAMSGIVWIQGMSAQPDNFTRTTTFWVWTVLLLGGAATVLGPVLGSVVFWTALVIVRGLAKLFIPTDIMPSTVIEPFSLVLVGVALMLLVVLRPQGILGNKKELALRV